jgi:signal transduction histidine kinase
VEEENNAFLQLTTHIINENDIDIALEYIEHYTHIHQVNIEVVDEDDNMLFSSDVAHQYTSRYQIDTLKGTFIIFVDNTNSNTVNAIEANTIYVNVSLLIIYVLAILILVRNNKRTSKEINQDIENVLKLIDDEKYEDSGFNHSEFKHIHRVITKYLENIDLLTEQKSMNMKGLAHDIKTPLTLVYSYFEKVLKSQKISEKETKNAFESAKRINELLHDIIEDNKREISKEINLSTILHSKVVEYTPIFKNKDISIVTNIDQNIMYKWSEKDFVRVIDNLISNAYYYSKVSSVFEVNLTQGEKIEIDFTSCPLNINDIDNEKIFKKEYRGSLSHRDNGYGKGYGLYLCRLLLSSVRGSIQVETNNRNVKFTIIL